MVSVRKSHLTSEKNIEQWLAGLAIPESKQKLLEQLWLTVSERLKEHPECQRKSFEMVEILAELNLDIDSLSAAFLTPLYDAKLISLDEIKDNHSKDIYLLCKSVRQMQAIQSLQKSPSGNVASKQIDNIRRMLLAMVDDVRAVVIKLAERLCYLRAVKKSDEETRVLAAKETNNIYAPLANRLGIGQLKWELEDLSFRYLHPDTYMNIASWLDGKRLDREQYMTDFVATLQQNLDNMAIKGNVYGRPKHIYSIWKKMQKKSLSFDQLFDVRAVRVIVDKLQDCYSALGIVHTSWKHLPNEFDDYVATPKPNGYQSIHTVVLGPEGKPVEVQIRTQQMDEDAELGVAAHWKYKEGSAHGKVSGFDEKITWLRKILQWQDELSERDVMLDELRSQVFEDRIYTFTPNGDVIDLPVGSTPLDFAYHIHSNVGHCCIGAKISGRIVPFTYQLQTGDQVEILTSKTPNPSRDWLNPNLNYLHSSRSRSKVQHFFKQQDRDKHLDSGKEQLEAELNKHHITVNDISGCFERFNVHSPEELYIAIGSGHARLQQVINYITQQQQALLGEPEVDLSSIVKQPQNNYQKADKNGITVSGVGNLLTHIANCCRPVPGDSILGFITQGRGISVHKKNCEQLMHSLEQHPEREVEVQWGDESSQKYQVSLKIIANDRQGLLRDFSTIISNERISIFGVDSHSDSATQTMSMTLKLEVGNRDILSRLINKINQIDDVLEVQRL